MSKQKGLFIENCHFVNAVPPVADALVDGSSDIVKMEEFGKVVFVIQTGVGATGTSTVTIEACDDVTPSNSSAIPFHYRKITVADTHAAVTAVAAAGVATVAGSNDMYVFEVDADALAEDGNGYEYVRLTLVEVTDSPVLAGILVLQLDARYASAVDRTQIT